MNKRQRKKWLKKHDKYVNPKDTWNLDYSIASYVLPRLKLFKKLNNAYPGTAEVPTPEAWNEVLDKMIQAFQIVLCQDDLDDRYWYRGEFNETLWKEDNEKKEEGLSLFAKYIQQLWW